MKLVYVLCFAFINIFVLKKIISSEQKKKKENNQLKPPKNHQINGLEPEIYLNYPYKAILKTRVAGFQLISCTSGIAPAVQNDSCLRVT